VAYCKIVKGHVSYKKSWGHQWSYSAHHTDYCAQQRAAFTKTYQPY